MARVADCGRQDRWRVSVLVNDDLFLTRNTFLMIGYEYHVRVGSLDEKLG